MSLSMVAKTRPAELSVGDPRRRPPIFRMTFLTMAAAAGLAAALPASALVAQDAVKISSGQIHGAVVGQVASFKGIPFAAPPVGDLRWRPPQPVQPWTGVRETVAYGPGCIPFGGGGNQQSPAPSEDCLYLNIWKPANAAPGAKLPVMFWLFGGAFRTGSASSPNFDGSNFAKQGVVLVTMNYRTGRLAQFAHPALTAEHPNEPMGNFGLQDILAALKWVQTNIEAFGGDTKNVTVFGQSSGAEYTHYLMASPASRGLFAKAIAESGFGRHEALPVKGPGETNGKLFAEAMGVAGTGPEAAKALRALSVAQLTSQAAMTVPGAPIMRPMIDGVVVVENYDQAFAAGHELKIPYITGGNSWEASLNADINKNPGPVLARAGTARDQLVALYGGDPGDAAYDFTTDSNITEPARNLLRLHAQHGQPTWGYYASYQSPADRGVVHGLNHGGEIRYVFGNLNDKPEERGGRTIAAATPEDWAMSKAMQAYWIAFAKTGNPGRAGGSLWAPYDPKADNFMEFGSDGIKQKPQFHKATLDLIEQINIAGSGVP